MFVNNNISIIVFVFFFNLTIKLSALYKRLLQHIQKDSTTFQNGAGFFGSYATINRTQSSFYLKILEV